MRTHLRSLIAAVVLATAATSCRDRTHELEGRIDELEAMVFDLEYQSRLRDFGEMDIERQLRDLKFEVR